MRIRNILSALAVLFAIVVALPQSASAGFRHSHDGWDRERVVTHHVSDSRFSRHFYRYGDPDPYHYRHVQPRYYPYYNSGYWVPARCYRYKCRKQYRIPRYYQSWGYPKACNHRNGCKRHHHRRHRVYHHFR